MRVINTTSLTIAWMTGELGAGRGLAAAFIVKATVDLVPGGVATLAGEQAFASGDLPHPPLSEPPPGQDAATSLRYGSDFALVKPAADVLLVGSAAAPGGEAVSALAVELGVGTWRKALAVIGDRRWIGRGASEPTPFVRMPLRWELAYGGPGWADNPLGRGSSGDLLPNLERSDALITRRGATPIPAGFGPLGMGHPQRTRHLGTWRRDHRARFGTGFPADFDWAFFNVAPLDQQVPGFLRGDEAIRLLHLHPAQALIETRLPGLLPRLALRHADSGRPLEELPLRLDTLWIDADALSAQLVWRAHLPVSDDALSGIDSVYLALDPLAAPRAERELFAALTAALPGDEADPVLTAIAARAGIAERERAALAEALAAIPPWPADAPPPPVDPDDPAWTTATVVAALGAGTALAEADLAGLALPRLAARGAQLPGVILRRADLRGADLRGANLAGAVLVGADLREADLTGADCSGIDATGVDFSGAILVGTRLAGAVLCGAVLRGVDCSGCQAAGADFAGAQATAARFAGAALGGALFTAAQLAGADFTGADLASASLGRADASGADFTGANLGRLKAAGCDLSRAILRRVAAGDAVFSQCRLAGADLSLARLDAALFIAAEATSASFFGCALRRARFDGAILLGVVFDGADLAHATLAKSRLGRATFLGSNCFTVDFTAALEGELADFTGANLVGALLEPA